jgi:lysozyme
LYVYPDTVGLPTIGWDHLIKPGEHFTTVTQAQADALRTADLTPACMCVESHVTVPMNDNEYGALVCFTFNVDGTDFADGTLLRKLNAGDRTGAARSLLCGIRTGWKESWWWF